MLDMKDMAGQRGSAERYSTFLCGIGTVMGMMAFEVMQEQKNGRCFSLLFSTNASEEFHYTESKVRMRAKGNRERKRKHETRWASNGAWASRSVRVTASGTVTAWTEYSNAR